jgi:GntR family transcriptional regulator
VSTHAPLPRRLKRAGPKGEQLRAILQGLIDTLKPGDPLPSERELAERYGIARMTVRGEITRLAAAGLVHRVQGRGTFVAEARVAQAAALTSFTEDMRARGLTAGSTLRRQDIVAADDIVARHLAIEPGSGVVRIGRVRTADGEPLGIEEAFLPLPRFAGLESADLAGGSLFEVLEERFGVVPAFADQRVVAVAIAGEDAELLGVEAGYPGLRFQTLLLDDGELPLADAWSLFRCDRYEIRLRQVRPAPS